MRKLLILGFVLAACGSKKGSNDPPPPQPSTGAPIAFEAKSFKTGADRGGSVDVKAYNFSDKKVAQYMLLFRYSDASGAVLKVKPGTPFEKDHDFMSLSGKRYMCQPKSWCSFTIKNLDVPDKTAKVEVLAKSVTALKDDVNFEDKELFSLPGMDWPGEKPAEGSAAPEGSAGSAAPEGSAGSAAPTGSAAPAGSGSAG
ncbi:MAG TPA: hypothetical protein VIV11_00180 [Kofleriaceae bacterium]